MDIKKIKKAPYNPRKMSKDAKKALKNSLSNFDDISGITVNKRTGNIVAGNHRWEEVSEQHGGTKNLVLNHLQGEYYSFDTKNGVHTGFLVRVVDWSISKEKSANVTANSDLISGEYTAGLQNVLSEIKMDLDDSVFSALRLDELHIDLEPFDDDLDLDDDLMNAQEHAEEKNRMLDEASDEESSEVREIRSVIKVSIPSDLKDEVKADIMEFLAKKKYYDDVTIV